MSARGDWKQSRRELFAMYRKRAGRSGILCRVSGTDVDTQYETPRHDRARCATILKKTTKRARRTAHMHTALNNTPRHGVVAHLFACAALLRHLRCRSREAKRVHVAIIFARLSRCGFLWLLGCVITRQSLGGTSGVPALVIAENTTR